MTAYYCYVTKLVVPLISHNKLKLFSIDLVGVKAAVVLQEAGKSKHYIKLRI